MGVCRVVGGAIHGTVDVHLFIYTAHTIPRVPSNRSEPHPKQLIHVTQTNQPTLTNQPHAPPNPHSFCNQVVTHKLTTHKIHDHKSITPTRNPHSFPNHHTPKSSHTNEPTGGAGAGLEGHAEPGRHDPRPLALAAEQPQRLPLKDGRTKPERVRSCGVGGSGRGVMVVVGGWIWVGLPCILF